MNNKEGKERSWKRGKQGMKTKDAEEEPWKRGKVKPEKREGEMTNEVEKEKPSNKNLESERSELLIFLFDGFSFSTLLATQWKRKNPRKKSQKLASLAFEIVFRGFFLFHFIGHLSLPFFRFDLPSLPWFFLSLFIHHFFLVRSSALAVQASPQHMI